MKRIVIGVSIILALVLTVPAGAYISKQTFDWVQAKKLTVTTGGTQFQSGVQMDSTLAVTDAATLADDLTVSGDTFLQGTTIGTFSILTAGTAITVTNGVAFTPTATYQPIRSAGTVTPTVTIPSAGKQVCLVNAGSNNIVVADTGNQVLGGNRTLGQYDVLCVLSDGTRIIELVYANN